MSDRQASVETPRRREPAPGEVATRGTGAAFNLLRALIDHVPDQIYAKDPQGRFLVANAAVRRFFNVLSEDQIIGRTDADFFPPLAASSFAWEEQEIIRTGRPLLNREALIHADPEQWIVSTKVPLRDAGNRVVGIVGINRDITQHKLDQELLTRTNRTLAQREQELLAALADLQRSQRDMQAIRTQLVEADKMELVGRLAAGVAHEVKNPLAIIGMAVDFLAQCAAPERREEFPRVLQGIRDAVRRADTVIRALLDFSVPRALNRVPSAINEIIEQSQSLVRHELVRRHITWRAELAADLPRVKVDVIRIEQVLVNLFLNAAQAMPPAGILTVRTRLEEAATPAPDASQVVVEVLDTGPGIPQPLLPKVFEPFFTTKPTGQGTGLGLTVARAIVEQHGGVISLRNRPEGGVCAAFTVPVQGVTS